MAERVLVPIDQQKQVKVGWSNGFTQRDVMLRYDNPDYRYYINSEFLRGLPRLGGQVIDFTVEFAANKIPKEYRREGFFDLSLGAQVVRLTTGGRVLGAVGYAERDTLGATASNLKHETWVFDAEQIQDYVPPVRSQPNPRKRTSFWLRDIRITRRD